MIGHALRAGAEFEWNQRLTRAELARRRLLRFRQFAAWLRERSPYYRRVMAARRIEPACCAPEHFPELTKREVIENFDEISTEPALRYAELARFLERDRDPGALYRGRFHVVQTSGSSGEIGTAVFQPHEWIRGLLHSARLGSKPRWRKRLAYVGATRGHFAGVSAASSARGVAALLCEVRSFDVNAPMSELVAGLNAFQPATLTAYATVLAELARAQLRGALRIAPSEVFSGGEAMRGQDPRTIERAFGIPAANMYMSSEHLMMGFAPPGHDGLLLCEDDLIYECRSDCTLVTNLFNRTVPLIRYRMNDILRPLPDDHPPHPRFPAYRQVRTLVGRQEHVPWFRNDRGERDFIHPLVLDEFFVEGLELYQIQLIDERRFVFRARLRPGLGGAARDEVLRTTRASLRQMLVEKHMAGVSFELEPVEALRPDPKTGKFRLICPAEELAERARDAASWR